MKALVALLLVAGCGGFHVVGGHDLAVGDGGAFADGGAPGNDSAPDLAGGTVVPPGADLAGTGPIDLAPPSKYGPGPLGALPTGYCCLGADECRSRRCISYGPSSSGCSDPCTFDSDCNGGPISTMICDHTLMVCVAGPSTGGACLGEEAFTWGKKPTGTCCDATGATPGSDCEGGWCIYVGPLGTSNPTFCTQGCDDASPCPTGFGCKLQGGGANHPGVCVFTASLGDPNTPYGCSP